MRVGVLGLQGAFQDHLPILNRLGVRAQVIRDSQSLASIDRLILPGGESTVMAKFLSEMAIAQPLKRYIAEGMPVWGICAGTVLLAAAVDDRPGSLSSLPIRVSRNAYGRQIASNIHSIPISVLYQIGYPAIFIRAPKITNWEQTVQVHARLDEDPVFLQFRNIMATTFHPELNKDTLFHRYFIGV
jgi:5'-phosphate synthase pdxT subunit